MKQTIRVAVGGGKGGTGKSTVSVNLAVALARSGMRTVLVDADLGAANLHTMLGIERVGPTLQALFDKKITSLEEACLPTLEPRLFLVPGVGAVVGGANPAHAQKLKAIRHVAALDADVVLIDLGAGTSFNSLDFFELGDLRLVVTTPELTSVQNAYGFLKGALHRAMRSAARTDEERDLLASASDRSTATERISDVLARIERTRPDVRARLELVISSFNGAVIGNMMGTAASSKNAPFALARLCKDFLSLELPALAQIPMSSGFRDAIAKRAPYMTQLSPRDPVARAFASLAEHVLQTSVLPLREARERAASDRTPSEPPALDLTGDAMLEAVIASLARREERLPVDLDVHLRVASRATVGRVLDLSPHGACVTFEGASVSSGAPIEIAFERPLRTVLQGTVRYATGTRAGVELDESSVARSRELLAAAVTAPVASAFAS